MGTGSRGFRFGGGLGMGFAVRWRHAVLGGEGFFAPAAGARCGIVANRTISTIRMTIGVGLRSGGFCGVGKNIRRADKNGQRARSAEARGFEGSGEDAAGLGK
jgi:hypothetical protein